MPVACSDFAIDSVDGQRGRPSGVMRLDLLKVVGSSPAFLARPEGESPARAARRSSAVQIWAWVSMGVVPVHRIATDFCPTCRNYSLPTERSSIFFGVIKAMHRSCSGHPARLRFIPCSEFTGRLA